MLIFLFSIFGFLAACWAIYRIFSRKAASQVRIKELFKAWDANMPREIKEHRSDFPSSRPSDVTPSISDTSHLTLESSGPSGTTPLPVVGGKLDQLGLFGTDDGVEPASFEKSRSMSVDDKPRKANRLLLRIYLGHLDGSALDGALLVSSLNKAGLIYGDMEIFHFCDNEHETSAIFSAASMLEPGTFDLGKLELLRTPGIVLFMSEKSDFNTIKNFELMLEKATTIALILKVELFSAPGSLWTVEHEKKIFNQLGLLNE
jgi:hypothetical protein